MIELAPSQIAELRPWFTPERPGPVSLAKHVINTGYGRCWSDRWPEPRAVLIETAGNYLLRGDPDALTPATVRPHIAGFVDAPATFLPLLQATFDRIVTWERVIYALHSAPRRSTLQGFLVRQLGWQDAAYLEELSEAANWVYKTWVTPANLAASGYVWGAFAGERLVSVANIFFLGDEYEEIGVATEPEYRGLGLNAACVGGLCEDIQRRGHIPSWTTSTDNLASQRVAEKVGFTFDRHDVLYVIGIDLPA
jgi:RimJ/RimL family protein N-acetyltransferase